MVNQVGELEAGAWRPVADENTLPLRGVKIVDMSRYLAGPFSGTVLGDLGAEVIKIESVDRDDPGALQSPMEDGISMYYIATTRNKDSIALDLTTPEGYEIFSRICADADAVVENYRRDVPERLGVDYESLKKIKPDIVLCAVRSFASEGSLKSKSAYDMVVQAYTGLMSVTGPADGEVARAGVAVADLSTGLYAALGLLSGIFQARQTGKGSRFEIALVDTGLSYMALQLVTYLNMGITLTRSGTEHPSMAPLRVFNTKTVPLLVMAAKDEEFERLCHELGKDEWINDVNYATNDSRVKNRTQLHANIGEVILTKSADEWASLFEATHIPCSVVRSVDAIAIDPDVYSTMITTADHPTLGEVKLVRNPLTFNGGALPIQRTGPGWGEDTDAILATLGYGAAEISNLRDKKIVR